MAAFAELKFKLYSEGTAVPNWFANLRRKYALDATDTLQDS